MLDLRAVRSARDTAAGIGLLLLGCAPHGDGTAAAELRIVDITPGPEGCAAWSDGHVECWRDAQARAPVAGLRDAEELVKLAGRVCARRRDGRALCWPLDDLSRAAPIEGFQRVAQLVGEGETLCARRRDETIRCVNPEDGRRLDPALPPAIDIAVGSEVCAVTTSGELRCVGADGAGSRVSGIEGATALALGDQLGCAITKEGEVRCWERSIPSLPGLSEPAYDSPVIAPERVPIRGEVVELATSDHAACARTRNGPVYCWGDANWLHAGAEPTAIAALEGSARLILSSMAACGVLDERRSSCTDKVGNTMVLRRESLPEPKPADGVAERVELYGADCLRTVDGELRCGELTWPGARYGAIAASFEGLCSITGGRVHCGRLSYAALVAPSANPSGRPSLQPPHSIVALDDAVSVAHGQQFACALRADHTVWCWGANSLGQSGVARPYVQAKRVLGVADAVALDVEEGRGCAHERGGAVKCWRASAERRHAVLHSRYARDYFDRPFYERYAAEAAGTAPRGDLQIGRWSPPSADAGGKPAGPYAFRCVLGPDGISRCHGACPEMPVPMTCNEK